MNSPVFLTYATTALFFATTVYLTYKLIETKKRFRKYEPITNLENEENRLNNEITATKEKFEKMVQKYKNLERATLDLEDKSFIMEFGLYEPKYNLGNSEEYKVRIEDIREKQKAMIKEDRACFCNTTWTVSGSKKEGQKAVNRTIKLALNAFNIECDNLIMKVKFNNLGIIKERIEKHADKIRNLISPLMCDISQSFVNLKIEELELVHEYTEKLQREKDEQREIQELMREEARALKEYEDAKARAEKEEKDFQKALDKAKKEVEKSSESEKEALILKIKELEANILEAQQSKERALSMAQQTRRGYVYVISNIGSFGENIYKIGMTRRLEPMDRVRELGDASVPFPFDVHAMISSEDAPTLERELHKKFDDKKVNMTNERKEFFRVSIHEVRDVCKELGVKVEFTLVAEAKDYMETLAILRAKSNNNEVLKDREDLLSIDDVKVA